jgi:hypothetical protein
LFEFLGKFLQRDPRNEAWADNRRTYDEVSKELKGLKVRFIRPDKVVRDYRANGLTKDSISATFPMTNDASGETYPVSVYDYFLKYSPYKMKIQFPKLPCLHVGNPAKQVKHWQVMTLFPFRAIRKCQGVKPMVQKFTSCIIFTACLLLKAGL